MNKKECSNIQPSVTYEQTSCIRPAMEEEAYNQMRLDMQVMSEQEFENKYPRVTAPSEPISLDKIPF